LKSGKGVKVAIVSTHPIQYYSPWFRHLAEQGESLSGSLSLSNAPQRNFSFELFYAHQQTAKGQADAGFGVEFEWDVPLLEGYPHRFLKNVSKRPGLDWFGGCDCPEIGEILVKEGFTHVLLIGWHKKVFWQAFWAAKKAGIKVLSRGDSHLGKQKNPLKIIIKEILYRILLPRFDAHLFVGRRNLEYLKHYGVSESRLFFSPHFVDNQWWSTNAGLSVAGDGKREAGGSVKFLFAGKFTVEKRPMDPLLALKEVPDAKLLYVGDGPMRAQMEQEVRISRLEERVQLLGFKNQRELPALLASIDCLILPGNESWGLIVNEAMACGKPAIVSKACGCAPDLIEGGKTGFSFPCGNIQALTDAMGKFCQGADQDWQTAVQNKIKEHSIAEATNGMMKALQAVSS
jgi:glycosyltransferase involved in cell wall biosynthesis